MRVSIQPRTVNEVIKTYANNPKSLLILHVGVQDDSRD